MSEQRLSSLQKWILKSCLSVTALFDRSALGRLKNAGNSYQCKECPKTRECVYPKESINDIQFSCKNKGRFSSGGCSYFTFYREDILLSYFKLEPDNDKLHLHKVQHFRSSPDYTKAHVTAFRSISSLAEKSLVTVYQYGGNSMVINLTEGGISKAAELLGVGDYESPFKA